MYYRNFIEVMTAAGNYHKTILASTNPGERLIVVDLRVTNGNGITKPGVIVDAYMNTLGDNAVSLVKDYQGACGLTKHMSIPFKFPDQLIVNAYAVEIGDVYQIKFLVEEAGDR